MAEKQTHEESEDEEGIIELIDDEGKIVKFKLLDVTEYKGNKYALLLPAEPNDEVADDEVAIFLYKEEEQILAPIEDDDLLEEVFEFWQGEEDDEEN